jgi:hypothetical protein
VAVDTYRAVCRRESEIEWVPGKPFHVTHAQLVDRTDHGSRSSLRRHLVVLARTGVITYAPGCGRKGERQASEISRVIPIPPPPPLPASKAGVVSTADTGSISTAEIGAASCEEEVLREIEELLADGTLFEVDP